MTETTKKSPMCAEQVPADAVLCPYCGTPFGEEKAYRSVDRRHAGAGHFVWRNTHFHPLLMVKTLGVLPLVFMVESVIMNSGVVGELLPWEGWPAVRREP